MKILFTTIIICSLFNLNYGQSFDNLSIFKKESIKVRYDKSVTTIIDKEANNEYEAVYSLMNAKINKSSNQEYNISFSWGPSADPSFTISKINADGSLTSLKTIGGEELVIPGNGKLYTVSRTNENHIIRRKFVLSGNSINETKQAAYYAGLKTQTLKPIKIYAEKEMKNLVASLPKNYNVEVLISEGNYFLIKTPFGLCGWIKLEFNQLYRENMLIKDLYFMGD